MNREYPPRYELWEFLATLTYEQVQQEYTGADRSLPSLIRNESLIAFTNEYTSSSRLPEQRHRAAA